MTKEMRSLTGHTSVHHDQKLYHPNKEGVFLVEDGHVDALKSHGLLLVDEADLVAQAELTKRRTDDLEGENARLKAQLAESALAKENEELRAQLAALQTPDPAAGEGKKKAAKADGTEG